MSRGTAAAARPRPTVPWRRILVPEEHGVWSLWAEPAVLGLALAPSGAGVAIALAGLAAVLAQQPLGLALADARRGRRYPRTTAAAGAAATGAALAAAVVALTAAAAGALAWWVAALAVAMAARTALVLRPGAPPVHPARIGVVETLLGVAWVVALAATLPGTIPGGPA